jgi:hypothetical protein
MASRTCSADSCRIGLQTGGFRDGCADGLPRASPGVHGGLGSEWVAATETLAAQGRSAFRGLLATASSMTSTTPCSLPDGSPSTPDAKVSTIAVTSARWRSVMRNTACQSHTGSPACAGLPHIQVQSPAMAPATAASSGPPVDERSRAEPIAAAILFSSGPLIVLEAGAKSLETADFDARAPSRIPRLSPVNHGGWGTQGGTRGSTVSPLGTARGSAQGPTAESDSRDGRAWRPTRKGLFWPLGSASVAARFAGERYVVVEPGRRRKGDPS